MHNNTTKKILLTESVIFSVLMCINKNGKLFELSFENLVYFGFLAVITGIFSIIYYLKDMNK